MDCGAACLVSVARFHKLHVPVARVRQLAGTDRQGTSLRGLIEAAEYFKFEAKGVKGTFDSLFNIPLPAIAHMIINDSLHHYLVISKVTKSAVVVMDPADGEIHEVCHQDFKKEWTGVLMLLAPAVDFCPADGNSDHFTRFWMLIKPHKDIIFQALFGSLIYTILGLSTAIFIQKIVDHVITGRDFKLLNFLVIAMFLVLVLRVLINMLKNIFILRTGQLIDTRLILGYYKHLLKLPQQFFDTMRVGEIMSRLNDAVKIRLFINDVSVNLLVGACMLISSLALMFTYYWKLALVMLLAVPAYSLIYFITNKLNKRGQRKLMEDSAALESQLLESLNTIGTIKRFGLEHHANDKTERKFIVLLKSVYRSGLNSLFSGASTDFTSQLFVIILLWLGSNFVLQEQITAGELLSFYALLNYFTAPVSLLIGMNRVVQDAMIASDRLFEIMDLDRETEKVDNKIVLSNSNLGNIRFNKLSFRYGTRENIFTDLELEIPLNQLTAVVGESGCGKSSLVSLLQKIYPINAGNIFFGEHSIKYITNSSLRKIIAVVPQITELFSGSVISNIAIGDEDIEMERVLFICRQLGLLDLIENLPDGFQTSIGENGVTLSGGFRQRLAIARALYRDPEILILDEATSSLDPRSEQLVLDTLNTFLSFRKTVIVIAHRLSSIQRADKIIVLKNGRVAEQGSHSELLARRSEYYSLWAANLPQDISSSNYEIH